MRMACWNLTTSIVTIRLREEYKVSSVSFGSEEWRSHEMGMMLLSTEPHTVSSALQPRSSEKTHRE